MRPLLFLLPHILLFLSLLLSIQLASVLVHLPLPSPPPDPPAMTAQEDVPQVIVSRDLLAEKEEPRGCLRGPKPRILSETVDLTQPMDFFQDVQGTPLALAQQGYIVRVRSDLFVVSRATLDLSAAQEITVRPVGDGGVRLARVPPKALLHMIGLRTGDVLRTLNGTPLDEVRLGILQERMLLLDFVRAGEAQQLRYLLVDAVP